METNLVKSNENTDPFEVFNYKNLGSVSCYIDKNGQPWFCHKDICDILGIKDSNDVLKRLEPKGVCLKPTPKNGGIQNISFINEGNLFRFITRSRKKEAQEFSIWASDTMLPALMNKVHYSLKNSDVSQIDILKGMISLFEEHQRKFKEINDRLYRHARVINRHSKDIRVVSKEGYFTIAAVAKLKGMSLSTENIEELDKRASKMCEEFSLVVGTISHPEFGRVHTYPYEIISDLLDEYFVK